MRLKKLENTQNERYKIKTKVCGHFKLCIVAAASKNYRHYLTYTFENDELFLTKLHTHFKEGIHVK